MSALFLHLHIHIVPLRRVAGVTRGVDALQRFLPPGGVTDVREDAARRLGGRGEDFPRVLDGAHGTERTLRRTLTAAILHFTVHFLVQHLQKKIIVRAFVFIQVKPRIQKGAATRPSLSE